MVKGGYSFSSRRTKNSQLKRQKSVELHMSLTLSLLQGLLTGLFSWDGGLLGTILLCGADFTTGHWAKINKDSILMSVQRN